MGLSSSQARLLNLTARMHDIEYKAQNLEAQKLQMANESAHVYQEYENALNKTKVQIKQISTDGSVEFVKITADIMKDMNYAFEVAVGNKKGHVYAYNQLTEAAKAANGDEDVTINNYDEALNNLLQNGFIVLVKLPKALGGSYTAGSKTIEDLLESDDYKDLYETNIATDTNLQEVSDDIELKKAEAKYEADMRKINQKDKKFDTDLAALEAERNAIKTEMDTLKSVAKENVDRTYKLFS